MILELRGFLRSRLMMRLLVCLLFHPPQILPMSGTHWDEDVGSDDDFNGKDVKEYSLVNIISLDLFYKI